MTVRVFQYSKCSTCRKALKWLDAKRIAYESVPIVEQPPSKAVLRKVLKSSGVPLRGLFNTSGESYRAGGYKERLSSMSEDEALEALAADGKLIKRPLVVWDGMGLAGFDEPTWSRELLPKKK